MTSILGTQVTELLTSELGRAPTAAEIASGMVAPQTLSQIHNTLNATSSALAVPTDSDLQEAIDKLTLNGGGIIQLQDGTYNVANNLVLTSQITIQGVGAGSVIDFGGGAYQIQILGSNPYTTGTVAISANSTAVVGTGTTFTSDMIGQSILLQDLWYEITAVTDATHLTIGDTYAGTTLSGASFTIATTIDDCTLSNFSVQNSSTDLIYAQYFDSFICENVLQSLGASALKCDTSSGLQVLGNYSNGITDGFVLTNCQYGAFDNNAAFNVTGGNGLTMNNCSNWSARGLSFEGITGTGMKFTNQLDMTIDSVTVKNVTGNGIEFVSGNSTISVTNQTIRYCTLDGIKLTATSDNMTIAGSSIDNNGGYGINIAAASCDTNIIGSGNIFSSNSSGAVNDLGTGTLIRSNSGVADN